MARVLLLLRAATAAVSSRSVYICDANFSSSASTPGAGFFGTAPLPDKAGYSIADDLVHGDEKSKISFAVDDPWLVDVLPMWDPPAHANRTAPFMTGFSSVRCLGGIAAHNKTTGTYQPLPEYDSVSRDPATNKLITNFTRIDATFDGYLAAGIREILVVLDNVPYAFVAAENQYFGTYGQSAAPDDPDEYAQFIGTLVDHLVERYSKTVVSQWRFRLGTEADGPRYGAPWQNTTYRASRADGSTFSIPAGEGLKQYKACYRAVSAAIKQRLPTTAFGPSNMAGVGVSLNMSETTAQLLEFGEYLHENKLPIDFAAASEYSRWDGHGNAQGSLMTDAIEGVKEFAAKATGIKAPQPLAIPLEVHEFGWAGWGKFNIPSPWPVGTYGGSWSVAAWLWLRHAGASRVFHWQEYFDRTLANYNRTGTGGNPERVNGYPLISGWGWAMAAVLRMTGCALDPPTDTVVSSEFVTEMALDLDTDDADFDADADADADTDVDADRVAGATTASRSSSSASADGATRRLATSNKRSPPLSTFGAFRVGRTDTKQLHYLLVSNDPTYNSTATVHWTLRVQAADFPQGQPFWPLDKATVAVSVSTLDASTAVHDVIKRRLVAAGRAVGDNDTSSTSTIDKMADANGQRWLAESAAEYMSISKQSLVMQPFEGTVRGADGGALVLEGEMQASSLVQLTLRSSSGS